MNRSLAESLLELSDEVPQTKQECAEFQENARVDTILQAAADKIKEEEKSTDQPLHETSEVISPSDVSISRLPEVYDFADPLELAQLMFPDVVFHDWQYKISSLLGNTKATQFDPFKLCLTACNGSGKDAFVITPFTIWFMMTRRDGLVVITSSSGVQLTAQTETYISRMAAAVNAWMGREVFKIVKRYIVCLDTGSECRMFATDEAGKAEGYHPLKPGAEMAIIVNEAKSVSEEIFDALSRCTGFNFWLEVSTPGEPVGHFYKSNTESVSLGYSLLRVTSYDCPHKSKLEIEQDKIRYGEHSALFRSKHLALFTQLDGAYVISLNTVNRCKDVCKTHIGSSWPLRVGIDVALSNGGDETNVYILRGNKVIETLRLHSEDITLLAAQISDFLSKRDVPKSSEHIYLDDGGVGRALWPLLRDRGWENINRVLNQFAAFNKLEFANRGAELWFNVNRMIEECVLLLPHDDAKFMKQLTTRQYKRSASGKMLLQSKREMKALGLESPDRVDAYVLALHGLTVEDFHADLVKKPAARIVESAARVLSNDELINSSDKSFFVDDAQQSSFDEFLSWRAKQNVALNVTATIHDMHTDLELID